MPAVTLTDRQQRATAIRRAHHLIAVAITDDHIDRGPVAQLLTGLEAEEFVDLVAGLVLVASCSIHFAANNPAAAQLGPRLILDAGRLAALIASRQPQPDETPAP
jgi:hypothetical protein